MAPQTTRPPETTGPPEATRPPETTRPLETTRPPETTRTTRPPETTEPPPPPGPRACSVARTLEIVGEKWALLAVREVFLGNRRFDEMVRRTGAPRDTLAARLKTLVAGGILERRQYSEHPVRHEYRLTEAGRELYPVIMTLMRWGDKHLAGAEGPPRVFEHSCGHRLVAQVVCEACGEPVDHRDSRPVTPD